MRVSWFNLFIVLEDSIASVGRARIEEQKQTALINIQKNKKAALKQLYIEYVSADKAKTWLYWHHIFKRFFWEHFWK